MWLWNFAKSLLREAQVFILILMGFGIWYVLLASDNPSGMATLILNIVAAVFIMAGLELCEKRGADKANKIWMEKLPEILRERGR